MPRLERSVLIGYDAAVRKRQAMVPVENDPTRLEEIDVTELVFTDEHGDQVVWPTDEAGRVALVEQLTGVRIVT